MLTKYFLLSLYLLAQPGDHRIALTYDVLNSYNDAGLCEIAASNLEGLGHPPMARAHVERKIMCVPVEYERPLPKREMMNDDAGSATVEPQTYTLVSQASYKWSGNDKPAEVVSIPGFASYEACLEQSDRIQRITLGREAMYAYLRIDNICI